MIREDDLTHKLTKAFYAYPAIPADIRNTVEAAARESSSRQSGLDIRTWPAMDVVGAHIADKVRSEIGTSKFLIADVTVKNPNVYYEVGYAIGRGIPILPTVNRTHSEAQRRLQSDGHFDNIKFESYDNKEQLSKIIVGFHGTKLLDIYSRDVNSSQPLYILDTLIKSDFRNTIVSAIKDAKVFYRAFDPVETPRFSTVKVISEATSSVAAVIPLLAPHMEDADRHNLRGSFLAGLMHGLGKPVLMVQNTDGPVPADYRESVETPADNRSLEQLINRFASESIKRLQTPAKARKRESQHTLLQDLWLGASAAENEFRALSQYFLETSEYFRTIKGDGKIVVGRKGSGKTAIFFMARNYFREMRGTTVVDLKPESHELIELRELLTRFTSLGVASHTFSGFWYILILLEVALKLSDDLNSKAIRDQRALQAARELDDELSKFGVPARADFTARLKLFIGRISKSIQHEIDQNGSVSLDKLTNFVFGPEQRSLRTLIGRLLKDRLVSVLFDNLDKGWPATGIDPQDIIFVRSLIDALNRLQRDLSADDIDFRFSVFLRNDVYELLIENTSDRGKESTIPIDWSDREKLKVVIRKRIAASEITNGSGGSWEKFFPSKVGEIDSMDYVVDHSLMRPRFLIDIVERSISFAINRQHTTVTPTDLEDAVRQHSYYLADDFGYEIRDATGLTNQILDAFLGTEKLIPEQQVLEMVQDFETEEHPKEKIIEHLLWYGFLGIRRERHDLYIYDFNYSMRRLSAEQRRVNGPLTYVVNPAFLVGLSS